MPLNSDGWCSSCRHSALSHPRLACPWCGERATVGIKLDLGIGPETAPAEMLRLALAQRQALLRRIGEVVALRREASLLLLRDVPHSELAALTHHRIETLEKWAAPPTPRQRRPRAPRTRDQRPRKSPVRLHEAWKAHEAHLARQRRLLAQLEDPEPAASRLRPPLPPPGASAPSS